MVSLSRASGRAIRLVLALCVVGTASLAVAPAAIGSLPGSAPAGCAAEAGTPTAGAGGTVRAAPPAAARPALNGWTVTDIIEPDGTNNTAGFGPTGTNAGVIVYRSSKIAYRRRSTDGGVTWSARAQISPAGLKVLNVQVATYGSQVHVLMGAVGGTRHRHSANGGQSWDSTQILSFPAWKIARGPGGLVGVIGLGANQAWRVTISEDGGQTWGPTRTVGHWGTCVDTQTGPGIAVAGDAVVVLFTSDNGKLLSRRTTNAGDTWSAAKTVGADGNYWSAAMGVSGSTIVVAYDQPDDTSQRLIARRSTNRGATWSAPIPFGVDVTGAEVRFGQGSWHLVSSDQSGTWRHRSSSDGLSWSGSEVIDTGHGFFSPPIGVGAFTGGPVAAFIDGDISFARD